MARKAHNNSHHRPDQTHTYAPTERKIVIWNMSYDRVCECVCNFCKHSKWIYANLEQHCSCDSVVVVAAAATLTLDRVLFRRNCGTSAAVFPFRVFRARAVHKFCVNQIWRCVCVTIPVCYAFMSKYSFNVLPVIGAAVPLPHTHNKTIPNWTLDMLTIYKHLSPVIIYFIFINDEKKNAMKNLSNGE